MERVYASTNKASPIYAPLLTLPVGFVTNSWCKCVNNVIVLHVSRSLCTASEGNLCIYAVQVCTVNC